MNVNCERPVTVDENTYSKMISHRNLGLSFLEEERYSDALNEFEMLVNIADEEPLGYANLGLTYMRMSGITTVRRVVTKSFIISARSSGYFVSPCKGI